MVDETPAKTDAELIAGVLAGDGGDFKVLMERHQRAVFNYLYRFLLGDGEAARDLTQSVFLKVYQGLAGVDRSLPFQPWLFRIAHNEAANHVRSRVRRRESLLEEDTLSRLPDPAGESPEAAHAAGEEHQAVHRALARIKPKYREVLVLYFFEDQSYEEIATILGVSVGTVGTLIHRGKAKLRVLLEEAAPL